MPAVPRVRAGLRGPSGETGPSTEWRASGGYLQYRAEGSSDSWSNAVALSELAVGGSVFSFKGTVADTVNLPGSGNTNGDLYVTTDDSHGHVWDGDSWVDIGTTQGPAGADGATGAAGQGVPTGGSEGQYLRKTSGTNYATAWADFPAFAEDWSEIEGLTGFPAVIAAGDTASDARDAIGALGAEEVDATAITVNTDAGLAGPNAQLAMQNLLDRVALLEGDLANLTIY